MPAPLMSIARLMVMASLWREAGDYTVQQEPFGSGFQYKCLRDGHHFLTVIDDGGVFILRPHPGAVQVEVRDDSTNRSSWTPS